MSTVKTDTKTKIVELATSLIEEKGFTGFSYQDIADKLDIKKASIHYHFPAKEDLGIAVFEAFRQGIDDYIAKFDFEKLTPTEKMTGYFEFHTDMACDYGQISCIGAMTSEWNLLPDGLRERIEKFNAWHVGFIASILKEGMEKGEFKKGDSPEELALLVIATTKGALLLSRENRTVDMYASITRRLMESLKC